MWKKNENTLITNIVNDLLIYYSPTIIRCGLNQTKILNL